MLSKYIFSEDITDKLKISSPGKGNGLPREKVLDKLQEKELYEILAITWIA